MSRSTSKGSYIDEKLSKRVEEMDRTGQKQPVKTWARVSVIPPMFVGHAFLVSAGKKFVSIFVTEDMVGHRLGEFAPTRHFKGHGEAHKVAKDKT